MGLPDDGAGDAAHARHGEGDDIPVPVHRMRAEAVVPHEGQRAHTLYVVLGVLALVRPGLTLLFLVALFAVVALASGGSAFAAR